MAIKKYGPTTPGRRGMTVTDYKSHFFVLITQQIFDTGYISPLVNRTQDSSTSSP